MQVKTHVIHEFSISLCVIRCRLRGRLEINIITKEPKFLSSGLVTV